MQGFRDERPATVFSTKNQKPLILATKMTNHIHNLSGKLLASLATLTETDPGVESESEGNATAAWKQAVGSYAKQITRSTKDHTNNVYWKTQLRAKNTAAFRTRHGLPNASHSRTEGSNVAATSDQLDTYPPGELTYNPSETGDFAEGVPEEAFRRISVPFYAVEHKIVDASSKETLTAAGVEEELVENCQRYASKGWTLCSAEALIAGPDFGSTFSFFECDDD